MPEPRETAPMRQEDVPTALVDEFERRLERAIGGRVPNEPTREDIAIALAAVLPLDRTAERAKVAEEILADADPFIAGRVDAASWEGAHRAAWIANGKRTPPEKPNAAADLTAHEAAVRAKVAEEFASDVLGLARDYGDESRDVIASMPFLATLNQIFLEKYGVDIDRIARGEQPTDTPGETP